MIYKKCRRFYNGFNEFIINTVYDQIYLKIVMIYTVQRVYTFHIMNMIKQYIWLCSAYDAILYLNEFRFPKLQVHVYTLSHIFQKFSRHFELHPLCSAGPRQKTWCINHLIFHVSVFVLRGFIILLYFQIFLNVKVYVILCLTILWTIQLYIDIKWISKKLFIHIFVVLFFNIKWFSK